MSLQRTQAPALETAVLALETAAASAAMAQALLLPLLLLLAMFCAVGHGASCQMLGPSDQLVFDERAVDGAWKASLPLTRWQESGTVTISFKTNTELTQNYNSVLLRSSPRVVVLQLSGVPGGKAGSTLRLEGKGGCWQPTIDKCTADVACESPDSPSPPPLPPVRSPPPPVLHGITPSIVSKTCHSVLLAWTSPLPSVYEMEYLVTTLGFQESVEQTAQDRFEVQGLHSGSLYQFQVSARIAGQDQWSEAGAVVKATTLSTDRSDPASMQMSIGRSTGSCTSLRLALPDFGRCNAAEFLSVEWRTSREEGWKVVMDHVDVGDLADNVLPIDALDPHTRYELRTKLHQAQADGGKIIEGPSTGGLLVDMRNGELRQVSSSLSRSGPASARNISARLRDKVPCPLCRHRRQPSRARPRCMWRCPHSRRAVQGCRPSCCTPIRVTTTDGLSCRPMQREWHATTVDLCLITCVAR